jgi:hypothetical protein
MSVDVLWPLVHNNINLLGECYRVRYWVLSPDLSNPSMLTFSIYTLPSCTCPVGILQPLLINQDQSRHHLHQVCINAPVKGVSR